MEDVMDRECRMDVLGEKSVKIFAGGCGIRDHWEDLGAD
jgi:hypothetical protein